MQSPRDLGLPYDDWRPLQRLAIRTILYAKTPHIVVNAPTGSGKSTLGAALTRLDQRRQIILTATNGLLTQYDTFPFLVEVKGASNYKCLAAHDEFKRYFPFKSARVMCDDGPCHSGETCTLKDHGCLYFDHVRAFLAAQAGKTNYAMWLASRTYARGLGVAQRLICDEAHALPEQLMSAHRIEISKGLLQQARHPGTLAAWKSWAHAKLADMNSTAGDRDDLRMLRDRTVRTLTRLSQVDRNWAWDEQPNGTVAFEPTIPRLLMPSLQHLDPYSSIVYLSATITPHTLDLLGVDRSDVTFFEMKSYFPRERRPVYLVRGGRVDFRMTDAARGHWLDTMASLCHARRDRSGIIHSVSFVRAEEIYDGLSSRTDVEHRTFLLHRRGQSAADVVAIFKRSPRGTILISPSVMTGFDFPYTQCEFQIIAKVPFPDTRSRIMKARIRATKGYRDVLTMTTLVQACGRGMRAEDDQCETFIVDEHANWFLDQYGELAPSWFTQAIVRTGRRILPPPRLEEAA